MTRKFICGVVGILLFVLSTSLLINSQVAERYYLRQQTNVLRKTGSHLKEYLAGGMSPDEAVSKLEASEKALIVYSENTSDYDRISQDLREKFRQKGLGFQKFWLWDQDYLSAVQNGVRFRLYRQDRLNYSILVEYIPDGPYLYAAAIIIPNAEDFIGLMNRLSILLYLFSLVLAVILISLLVRHITNPLRQIEKFAQGISRQEYGELTIHTRDELETVANSMNQMSHAIQQQQKQMKHLLDDVAHDLKTPISLIGMYAAGMKDGLDDGTFLETIILQNAKMSRLVERLLSLSGIEGKDHPLSELSLDSLLNSCIEEQNLLIRSRNLDLHTDIASGLVILGNPEMISALFSNLLSNAVKYASGGTIEVTLRRDENRCHFLISNEIRRQDLDMERIWEPFYVGEASRNKAMSGTGLGLAIVKKITEQFHYSVRCVQDGGRILFEIIF